MSIREGNFMFNTISGITRIAAVSAFLSTTAGPALALDVSPDLFIDGSCEDVIDWAAQPVEILVDDFRVRLGDGMAKMMKSASGPTVLKMTKSMPVDNNWFENNCTFTEAQLAEMGNLHTAYVAHLEALAGE